MEAVSPDSSLIVAAIAAPTIVAHLPFLILGLLLGYARLPAERPDQGD